MVRDNEKAVRNSPYLSYRVATKKRGMTYSDYIDLTLVLLYGIYMMKTYTLMKPTFKDISEDAVKQAKEEIGREPRTPFLLTWKLIEEYLVVRRTGNTLREYLSTLVITDTQEAHSLIVQLLTLDVNRNTAIVRLTDKQSKRIVNIHEDKESGAVVDLGHQLWHEMYIEPYREENVQVRFIAEMDRVTTEMCKGMDNMLFYTNDWNRYYRYSDLDKRDVLYTTFGLATGENLPPINNHFHWCRSTITYLTDLGRNELNSMLIKREERYALNQWRSFDFYAINEKMRNGIPLDEGEKALVKNFNGYLNKMPNYNGNIVRVLEMGESDTAKFLNRYQVDKFVKEDTFLAFSTRTGYNPKANIELYVENSHFAKDVREGTRSESEVVYRPKQAFRVVQYKYENGKHMFLLEEIQL